jgi:molybdopterin converting factor small subunit
MATIRYYAPLRGIIGHNTDNIPVATVKDALNHIKSAYGKDAYRAAKCALIVINGTNMDAFSGKKTALQENDTLGFLPLAGGG